MLKWVAFSPEEISCKLEKQGTRLKGQITFAPGTTTKFFAVIKDSINMDLMPLIGGKVYENPEVWTMHLCFIQLYS
jgi:hypothetical protein